MGRAEQFLERALRFGTLTDWNPRSVLKAVEFNSPTTTCDQEELIFGRRGVRASPQSPTAKHLPSLASDGLRFGAIDNPHRSNSLGGSRSARGKWRPRSRQRRSLGGHGEQSYESGSGAGRSSHFSATKLRLPLDSSRCDSRRSTSVRRSCWSPVPRRPTASAPGMPRGRSLPGADDTDS